MCAVDGLNLQLEKNINNGKIKKYLTIRVFYVIIKLLWVLK